MMQKVYRNYNDLINVLDKTRIEEIKNSLFMKDFDSWVVQEKIRGKDLAILVDPKKDKKSYSIQFALDSGYNFMPIDEFDKNFFASDFVKEVIIPATHKLYESSPSLQEDGFVVHGVIDDNYQKNSAIDGLDFFAFDIWHIGIQLFLFHPIAQFILLNAGFKISNTLFEGSLDECLSYPNCYPTTIKEFSPAGVMCAGNIIRPTGGDYYLDDGFRVLLKNKLTK